MIVAFQKSTMLWWEMAINIHQWLLTHCIQWSMIYFHDFLKSRFSTLETFLIWFKTCSLSHIIFKKYLFFENFIYDYDVIVIVTPLLPPPLLLFLHPLCSCQIPVLFVFYFLITHWIWTCMVSFHRNFSVFFSSWFWPFLG